MSATMPHQKPNLTHKVPVKLWASRANVGGDRMPMRSCWETFKAGCRCLERITGNPEVNF